MCGRYTLHGPITRLQKQFGLDDFPPVRPRYNIAPMSEVPVVRVDGGRRVAALHRWSLLPGWVRDPAKAPKLNNARAETVAEKPSFRAAFRRWRCIVPASGFYEWQALREGGKTVKQPWYIRPADDEAWFGFAGLTERWVSPEGDEVLSCCIVTTEANALMAPIHDRMPVILRPDDYARWLDPENGDLDALKALLLPADPATMAAWPVSRAVNSGRKDAPEMIEPLPGA